MPQNTGSIESRIEGLRVELLRQGRTVQQIVEDAVEAIFDRADDRVQEIVDRDRGIDDADVRIEREAVDLMTQAVQRHEPMSAANVRLVFTIVKVNNELERIADLAVNIAEQTGSFSAFKDPLPTKFRVMANSVIGIIANTVGAWERMDAEASRLVLATDDATESFKLAILREVENALARGEHSPDFALAMNRVAARLARIGDHCTNIAEQIIYAGTGKIVRHLDHGWTEPEEPAAT